MFFVRSNYKGVDSGYGYGIRDSLYGISLIYYFLTVELISLCGDEAVQGGVVLYYLDVRPNIFCK